MLSEESKGTITRFAKLTMKHPLRDEMVAKGPIKMLDIVLGAGVGDSIDEDVKANREEAEKYLAGLLGMM